MFRSVGVPGHQYELPHMVGAGHEALHFISKRQNGDELILIQDGTTTETVIEVLIDRVDQLNKLLPCVQNGIATAHLEVALAAMKDRTAQREILGDLGIPAIIKLWPRE